MKYMVFMAASAAILFATVSCGGKSGKTQSDDAASAQSAETVAEVEAEPVEVTLTTPAQDVAQFMEEAAEIDSMIEICETSGDDVMVPTIQEMVVELDRRIVAYAKAYSERSDEQFEEFCTLLDVDPDHMREGFEVYGY
ncbi:MAG: hypothetical protein J6K38_05050 [Alistipes sp.]|nr:hypothetical protein [Alistipes sp.]